jgi:hypothetical protein
MIEDVMMSKNVPDPRDIRKYDLIGVFGMINYRTLRVSARLGSWLVEQPRNPANCPDANLECILT